jgi:hypothetical protein
MGGECSTIRRPTCERTLIKMKLKYIESEHADRIHLVQDASKWQAVLNITWLKFGFDIY